MYQGHIELPKAARGHVSSSTCSVNCKVHNPRTGYTKYSFHITLLRHIYGSIWKWEPYGKYTRLSPAPAIDRSTRPRTPTSVSVSICRKYHHLRERPSPLTDNLQRKLILKTTDTSGREKVWYQLSWNSINNVSVTIVVVDSGHLTALLFSQQFGTWLMFSSWLRLGLGCATTSQSFARDYSGTSTHCSFHFNLLRDLKLHTAAFNIHGDQATY